MTYGLTVKKLSIWMIKIPATILFTCNPYHGLDDREFVVRVSILTGGDKPKISLRIVKLEANEEDMA